VKADLKKQRIITVAKSCFTQYGYDKTTLDDIGKKLGLNKSSLYYYFKNKEEIFTEVVVQEADLIVRDLQAEMADQHLPEEKILLYMKRRLNYYRQILSLHQLSAESLRQIQPGFHELYSNLLKREITFVAIELRQMEDSLSYGMAHRIAELIINSADGIKHDEVIHNKKNTYDDPDYAKIERDIELLVRLVLSGVKEAINKQYLVEA